MQSVIIIFLFAVIVNASPAHAVDLTAGTWKGGVEIGWVSTGGNTNTQSLTGKVGVTNERDAWRHNLILEVLKSKTDGNTTAERYFAGWKSDYKFTARDYLFGTASYEKDKFSGFDYRAIEAVGYGRKVMDQSNVQLELEAGMGARQSVPEHQELENEIIGRGTGRFAWEITPSAKFTEDANTDVGRNGSVSQSMTAIKTTIVGNLAMKASYTIRHTSNVPAGVKKIDTITALTLVYTFGGA